jgi:cob(I)alamin adenosyltransferase
MSSDKEGYVVILTGDGKGKTTSALGMALRAVGQGFKVIIFQFIKGSWRYGELEAIKRLEPDLTIRPLGSGFIHVDPDHPDPNAVKKATEAWDICKKVILSGDHYMVVLDEINNAISYGLISVDEVIKTLQERPAALHVVLTGRDAHQKLIEMADLVTELNGIKHPYQKGAQARRGIEF